MKTTMRACKHQDEVDVDGARGLHLLATGSQRSEEQDRPGTTPKGCDRPSKGKGYGIEAEPESESRSLLGAGPRGTMASAGQTRRGRRQKAITEVYALPTFIPA